MGDEAELKPVAAAATPSEDAKLATATEDARPDIRCVQASVLLRDAKRGLSIDDHDLTSWRKLRIYAVYRNRRVTKLLMLPPILLVCVLPWFERPGAFPGAEAPWPVTQVIELLLLAALAVFEFAIPYYFGRGRRKNKIKPFIGLAVCIGLCVIDCILSVVFSAPRFQAEFTYPRWSRVLRIYFVWYKEPRLRIAMRDTLKAFFDAWSVFVTLILVLLFFSCVGTVLFSQSNEKIVFTSLIETIYQLVLLFSTCNNPDVGIPGYNQNRLTMLFFVAFSLVCQILLLNVIICELINSWKKMAREEAMRYIRRKRAASRAAFALLSSDDNLISKSRFFEFFHVLKPHYSDARIELYWKVIDSDESGNIDENEFAQIIDVLSLTVDKTPKKLKWIPEKLSHRMEKITTALPYKLFTGLFPLAVVIVFLVQADLEISQRRAMAPVVHNVLQVLLWILFLFDVVAHFFAAGSKKLFMEKRHNVVNLALIVGGLVVIIYSFAAENNAICRAFFCLFLVNTMELIASRIRVLENTFEALLESIPALQGVFLTIFCWFYIWSILGIEIFHDDIRMSESAIQNTDWNKLGYWNVSFSNFGNALCTCWVLMIVNNWHVIHSVYAVATGSAWVRLYFIPFFVLNNMVSLNVVLACLVEYLLLVWELQTPNAQALASSLEWRMRKLAESLSEGGGAKEGWVIQGKNTMVRLILRMGAPDPNSEDSRSIPAVDALMSKYPKQHDGKTPRTEGAAVVETSPPPAASPSTSAAATAGTVAEEAAAPKPHRRHRKHRRVADDEEKSGDAETKPQEDKGTEDH